MQIVDMFKPIYSRRNSLPNSVHRSKTKSLPPKTEYNPTKNSITIHDSKRPKSKTPPTCFKLNPNESYTGNVRNYMDHSLSDGDQVVKRTFQKVEKKMTKKPQLVRSQPIDAPNKRLQEMPLHHTPPSYESPQKHGGHKKFKEDHIEQLVIEKYALFKQLMSIDERCGSPQSDNFYAGAKFSICPSPGDLPLPPMHWLNSCQAQENSMQKSHLIFNITI